jgi:hypothetical protein
MENPVSAGEASEGGVENPVSGSDGEGRVQSLGHQVVEQVGSQVLGCSPNLICFGEGTFK